MAEAEFSRQLDETRRDMDRMELTNRRSRQIVALGEAALALWKAGTVLPDGLAGILRQLAETEARLAEITPSMSGAEEPTVPVLEQLPAERKACADTAPRPTLDPPAAAAPVMPETPVPTMDSLPRRVGVPTDHAIGVQAVPSLAAEVENQTAEEARRAVSAAVDRVREGAASAGKKVYQSIDEILSEMLKDK